MKKYLLPLAIVLAIGLGLRWVGALLTGQLGFLILTMLRAFLLFWFGLSLRNTRHKRHETWPRKVAISFFMIFFLVWELGYVMIPELKKAFEFLGIEGTIIHLIYVYCGWSFFD